MEENECEKNSNTLLSEHIEKQYVQDTYEKISYAYQDKRQHEWSCVINFLESQKKTIKKNTEILWILDAGCGNGKYFRTIETQNTIKNDDKIRNTIKYQMIGLDIVRPFLSMQDDTNEFRNSQRFTKNLQRPSRIIKEKSIDNIDNNSIKINDIDGTKIISNCNKYKENIQYYKETITAANKIKKPWNSRPQVQGDICSIPFREGYFDGIICAACIHHLSTLERRQKSILEMQRVQKIDGKLLLTVWCMQETGDQRKSRKSREYIYINNNNSNNTTLKTNEQREQQIPWDQQQRYTNTNTKQSHTNKIEETTRYYRYYHLFTEDELNELSILASKHYMEQYPDIYINIETKGVEGENCFVILSKTLKRSVYMMETTKLQYPQQQNYNKEQNDIWKLGQDIQKEFPPVDAAFMYGSGVFKQKNINNTNRMIDIILVVTDPERWHHQNIQTRSSDYSCITKFLGIKSICKIQRYGGGVLFHPFIDISIDNRRYSIKYGVVGKKQILEDLLYWKHLYICGRLHKPVLFLKNNKVLDHALSYNLQQAASIAVGSLGMSFTEYEQFKRICELSYGGDIRWSIGAENINKINNIVEGMIEYFRIQYKPILPNFIENDISSPSNTVKFIRKDNKKFIPINLPIYLRNISSPISKKLLKHTLYQNFFLQWALYKDIGIIPKYTENINFFKLNETINNDNNNIYIDDYKKKFCTNKVLWEKYQLIVPSDDSINNLLWGKDKYEIDIWIRTKSPKYIEGTWHSVLFGCKKIVHKSSIKQTLKGLITAGPIKSISYILRKFLH